MDWGLIMFTVIILGGIPAYIKYFCNKMVDNHFSKALEAYRHELQTIAEQSKFDYQRKLQDFNLYTTKKHEHYIQLYSVLITAHGSVSYLASPLKQYSSYDFFNEEDLKEYLTKLDTPRGRTEELICLWKNNKNSFYRIQLTVRWKKLYRKCKMNYLSDIMKIN